MQLNKAGCGEKRIIFPRNDDPNSFQRTLEEVFPRMKEVGDNYDLLRTASPASRSFLEVLSRPSGGYTANYMADESNLNQAVCFIRPRQSLDLEIEERVIIVCSENLAPVLFSPFSPSDQRKNSKRG